MRRRPISGPFALTQKQNNANRIYCLNDVAEQQGLYRGMSFSDARAYCPDLFSQPADLRADQIFQQRLWRWSTRYCPWVGLDGRDGLILDITGSTHLFGGEAAMFDDIKTRLNRSGLTPKIGLADTRGAAWALAHFQSGIADPGEQGIALAELPVEALRLPNETTIALQRLGLYTIDALRTADRASLTRRFGPDLLLRLDQAIGDQPETVTPLLDPPHYGVRLTFPEPIGLVRDVLAGTARLLDRLCEKLERHEAGARSFKLTARRVDKDNQEVELRLANPMRHAARILNLFERGIEDLDAGFGIDQLRLEACQVTALPKTQMNAIQINHSDQLDDLITRIGTRIGLDNIHRFIPADSHIPERSFHMVPAAYSRPNGAWANLRPRPIRLFQPEAIAAKGARPPERFRWRNMALTTARSTGPERIMPEWWLVDDIWQSGMRDYWRIETTQGRRLWAFYTPQQPGWYVHGEFA